MKQFTIDKLDIYEANDLNLKIAKITPIESSGKIFYATQICKISGDYQTPDGTTGCTIVRGFHDQ